MSDDRGHDGLRYSWASAIAAVAIVAFLISSLAAVSLLMGSESPDRVGYGSLLSESGSGPAQKPTDPEVTITEAGIPPTAFALTLPRGWSFITFPVMNIEYRASNIGLKYGDIISSWNSLTQRFDKSYIIGISPPSVDFPITINTGYLVFSGANATLSLSGIVPPSLVTKTATFASPSGGWESFGFLGLNATRRASEVPGMFSGGRITVVAIFDPHAGVHVSYIVGLPFTDFVIPVGLGVWCFCTANGTFSYEPSEHPVASFTSLVDHMDVAFDASGSYDPDGTIVSYGWSFGDGGTAQGLTAAHTYAAPGTYDVTLRVLDETGMVGSVARIVEIVDSPPVASFDYVTDGMTVDFDASGSWDDYGIVSYTWDWGDGTSLTTTAPTASHTYLAGTSSAVRTPSVFAGDSIIIEPPVPYPVLGFVYDSLGNPAYGALVTVTDLDTGSVWTTTTEFEYGYYQVDLNSGSLPSVLDGWWLYGDTLRVTAVYDGMFGWNEGVSGSPGSETYMWLDVTLDHDAFEVTLTVTDSIGQTASVTRAVPVHQQTPPVADFTIAQDHFVVSVNGSGSYDPDGAIVSYAWDFGDGGEATGLTASHAYATLGTWWITLTVTDEDGLTTSQATQVTVNFGYPGPPDAYWYILYGTATDVLGNPVVDASVRVICLETGALWSLTTDSEYGFFTLDLGTNWTGWNPFDTIRVVVEKDGLTGANEGIIFGPGNEAYLWMDVVVS